MFIGHFAVGLAAKKVSPRISLGTFFLAAQFLDLLWPLFILVGLEHARIDPGNTAVTPLDFYDYPITHSLFGALLWSILLGLVYFMIRRERKGGIVLSLVVFSHWILDFLTHRPDLPLGFSGTSTVGLGLWNSIAGTLIVEIGLFLAGALIYARMTAPKDKTGRYGLWTLVAVLMVIYLTSIFGPPPPNITAIGIAGNLGWLFVLWGYWVDRHRVVRTQ